MDDPVLFVSITRMWYISWCTQKQVNVSSKIDRVGPDAGLCLSTCTITGHISVKQYIFFKVLKTSCHINQTNNLKMKFYLNLTITKLHIISVQWPTCFNTMYVDNSYSDYFLAMWRFYSFFYFIFDSQLRSKYPF